MSDTYGDPITPVEPSVTIRFFNWYCGHHFDCPSEIKGLRSFEQAECILRAVSNAIIQPGNARAFVFDDVHYREYSLTHDECALAEAEAQPIVLLFSNEAEFRVGEHLLLALQAVLGVYGVVAPDWTGAGLCGGDIALTTLTLAELQERAKPRTEPPARALWGPDVMAQARKYLEEGSRLAQEAAL